MVSTRISGKVIVDLLEHYVFIPFQVSHDTQAVRTRLQIIIYSQSAGLGSADGLLPSSSFFLFLKTS